MSAASDVHVGEATRGVAVAARDARRGSRRPGRRHGRHPVRSTARAHHPGARRPRARHRSARASRALADTAAREAPEGGGGSVRPEHPARPGRRRRRAGSNAAIGCHPHSHQVRAVGRSCRDGRGGRFRRPAEPYADRARRRAGATSARGPLGACASEGAGRVRGGAPSDGGAARICPRPRSGRVSRCVRRHEGGGGRAPSPFCIAPRDDDPGAPLRSDSLQSRHAAASGSPWLRGCVIPSSAPRPPRRRASPPRGRPGSSGGWASCRRSARTRVGWPSGCSARRSPGRRSRPGA